jgi:hypothetical protein
MTILISHQTWQKGFPQRQPLEMFFPDSAHQLASLFLFSNIIFFAKSLSTLLINQNT